MSATTTALSFYEYHYKNTYAEAVEKASQMETAEGVKYIAAEVERVLRLDPHCRKKLNKTQLDILIHNTLYLCGRADERRASLAPVE